MWGDEGEEYQLLTASAARRARQQPLPQRDGDVIVEAFAISHDVVRVLLYGNVNA